MALVSILTVIGLCQFTGPGFGSAVNFALAQDEQYRERQVLDPEKNEFIDAPVAKDSPASELEEARSLLAREQAKPARKILKKWTEANIGEDRYYEGLYLLAEAYFETRDFYKAYVNYDTVADNTAGDLFYKSLRRQMDVARAFLAGQKRIFWGFLRLPAYDDGLTILDRVWERVPGTRMGEEALKMKADYSFGNGDMDIAQDEYANLAKQYPSGRWITLATLRSAEAAASSFGGVKFNDKPLINADDRYREFKRIFPGAAEREGIDARLEAIRNLRGAKDLEVGRWYEKTKQVNAAGYYYRLVLKDWPDTPSARDALSRLRALGLPLGDESKAAEPSASRPTTSGEN